MSVLNDVDAIRSIDPENMYNFIFDLPEQMAKAAKLASGWNVPIEEYPDIKNIVAIGMGGSSIAADLARSFLSKELLIPFEVIRDYTLPEYVDDESLVIVSSYSGNTEETLAAFDDALDRKAMMVAITTGGLLEEVCALNKVPMLKIPSGMQPRAAIGLSFVPLFLFLEKVGLIENATDRVQATVSSMQDGRERMIEDNPAGINPAKQLAELMQGRVPVIYGGSRLTDVVARRWKGQICENAKTLAFYNVYPEFNHNELVGWSNFMDDLKDFFVVINLRDPEDSPKISARIDAVKDILESNLIQVIDIYASGDSDLERMFNLLQMGDFVSYYLAILNEVDPTPVTVIEDLKEKLAHPDSDDEATLSEADFDPDSEDITDEVDEEAVDDGAEDEGAEEEAAEEDETEKSE